MYIHDADNADRYIGVRRNHGLWQRFTSQNIVYCKHCHRSKNEFRKKYVLLIICLDFLHHFVIHMVNYILLVKNILILNMDRYTIIEKIGEGAQGIVLKAYDSVADKNVALKKLLLKNIENSISTAIMREMKILQQLKHRNIIKLLDAFPVGLDFIMVFEYMPISLWEIIKDNEIILTTVQVKMYIKMILEGIAYVHDKNIIHRDLKPANLLINEKGVLKIADFGLGRLMWTDMSRPYSHQIATRWYRAPELLYGARYYTAAIDMWSIGCIFGELLNKSPLFPGETDIEQLAIVLRYLGSPTSETWPELSTLPDYNKITFPYHAGLSWEDIIEDAPPEAIDLLSKILIYNSSNRLKASEALRHVYFYSKPYPSLKNLIKPSNNHRNQIKQKEITINAQVTSLFENLIAIA